MLYLQLQGEQALQILARLIPRVFPINPAWAATCDAYRYPPGRPTIPAN